MHRRMMLNLFAIVALVIALLPGSARGQQKSLKEQLARIEEELIQVKAESRQDTLNFPVKLNAKLAGLAAAVTSADAAPTKQSQAVFDDLSARIDAQLAPLRQLVEQEVPAFNQLVREADVPAIVPDLKLAGGK